MGFAHPGLLNTWRSTAMLAEFVPLSNKQLGLPLSIKAAPDHRLNHGGMYRKVVYLLRKI
jgi:hypothetical protein